MFDVIRENDQRGSFERQRKYHEARTKLNTNEKVPDEMVLSGKAVRTVISLQKTPYFSEQEWLNS